MSLTINTYKNTSPRDHAHKQLTNVAVINGNVKDAINILHPQIYIAPTQEFNYCYIEEFNRYYYASAPQKLSNDSMLVQLDVDVLMSHIDELSNISATVSRNENSANAYLLDENYKSVTYSNIVTKKFPQGLENNSIVLLTVG